MKKILLIKFFLWSWIFCQSTIQFNYTGNIYSWTVQNSGIYTIEAYGAQGGFYVPEFGSKGAKMSGDFNLESGEFKVIKFWNLNINSAPKEKNREYLKQ